MKGIPAATDNRWSVIIADARAGGQESEDKGGGIRVHIHGDEGEGERGITSTGLQKRKSGSIMSVDKKHVFTTSKGGEGKKSFSCGSPKREFGHVKMGSGEYL